jgi:NTP pyrophosphatase (non-canonical NTP hydrolase)
LLSGVPAGIMADFSQRGLKLGDFEALTAAVREFRDARDWRQFHSLRNLITSLNLEAAELLELTQWQSDAEVEALPAEPKAAEALRDECADILLYLLLIADKRASTSLTRPAPSSSKMPRKYPVDKAFGSRAKYSALG